MDLLLNDEYRAEFIRVLENNLKQIDAQQVQLRNQVTQLEEAKKKYSDSLNLVKRIDTFIKYKGVGQIKTFLETFSKDMEEAEKDRMTEKEEQARKQYESFNFSSTK